MSPLLLIALSTLVSEDLTCIATGVLVAENRLGFGAGAAACAAGIFIGDLLLVVAGRHGRFAARRFDWFRRVESGESMDAAIRWLTSRHVWVLAWSRFTPGLRLPVYVGAGLIKLPMRKVIPPLLAASAVWTPLLVGAAAIFGTAAAASGLKSLQTVLIASVVLLAITSRLKFEHRRRMLAFLYRKVRWEFWPAWAAYAPVVPYLLWLGIRHRCLTLFTAANPGITTGGLVGESKSAILAYLSNLPEFAARFDLIRAGTSDETRCARVRDFMHREGLHFPIVLKPDVGERGAGVAILRCQRELDDYLAGARHDVIVQEYIGGVEFGVFYRRYPGQRSGQIVSLAEKRLPALTGDGRSTLERLILSDGRAFCLHRGYLRAARHSPSYVPDAGEVVQLVEVGSHSRGAIFVNAAHLRTQALEAAVERAAQAHPGFYFGRFDVRAESIEAFCAGEFKILELNGVGAEAAHIYDPSVSIWRAYVALFRHWRDAFAIGAANRRAGSNPASIRDIRNALRTRMSYPDAQFVLSK